MARGENQKVKILFVAKYLWDYSDAEHPIRVGDKDSDGDCLVKFLAENGVDADRRSVYRDIQVLRDIYGMDIEGGQGGRYRLKSREFDFDDLCLLTECVNSARFLPEKKAKELVETVKSFASQYQAEALDKVLAVNEDRAIFQIYIIPFEAVALVNAETTVSSQQISGFRVSPTKIFIKFFYLFGRICFNVGIIVCAEFWHLDFGILVDAQFVVAIYVKTVPRVCLPKNEIEHL